jgi:hypothetical protein
MIHIDDDPTKPQTRYTLIKIGAAISAIAAILAVILAIWWAFRTPSESPVSPSNVSPAPPSPPASPLTPELVPPPSASPELSGEPTNPENPN